MGAKSLSDRRLKSGFLLFPRSANTRREGHVQCRERLGGLLRYYHQEAASRRVQQMSAQTETKSGKTMRIKDVRQELYTLVHTQGVDGLLHLYQRLEKRNRALLLCLLYAEAGWLILVNAWLRLERAYLKLRLFLRV